MATKKGSMWCVLTRETANHIYECRVSVLPLRYKYVQYLILSLTKKLV